MAAPQSTEAFRREVRAFLAEHLDEELSRKVALDLPLAKSDYVCWLDRLAERNWLAGHWPVAFGGCGWTPLQRYIFETECSLADAPRIPAFGPHMLAPVLMRYGSKAQQDRHLNDIRMNRVWWCQGYSEPNAGSDLAALQTQALRHGNSYVLNGQKMWTTLGHFADWMFCLVRTDSAAPRHQGISFLLVDMRSPGVEVRPIITIDGRHYVNEVFLTDVEVPISNRVGEEGQGWQYAKLLLKHERANQARVGESRRMLSRLKALAGRRILGGAALSDDPVFTRRIAEVEIELLGLEGTAMRILSTGDATAAEVAVVKIRGNEIQQWITELMMDAAGTDALDASDVAEGDGRDPATGNVAARYFVERKQSITGGSAEIQRNLLADQLLGR